MCGPTKETQNDELDVPKKQMEDIREERLSELRSSYLSVLSAEQRPIEDGESDMTDEELEPYRMLGDAPMDTVLDLLRKEGHKLGAMDNFLELAYQANEMKMNDAKQITPSQEAMCTFLKTYEHLPSWVDKQQLQRGQDVFLAYSPAAALSLYYRSLVPGFAAPKINAVVQSTAYLTPPARPDQSLQRILDTGELLAACTGLGVDALLPRGIGWKMAIHVRVLHAKIRFALLQRQGKRTWDLAANGIPINQEDMSATLLAFSVNVLVGIDLISGSSLSDKEKLDYLALWRYIGWLLGIETRCDDHNPLANPRLSGEPSLEELPPLDPCGPPPRLQLGVLQGNKKQSLRNPIQRSFALLQSIVNHLGDPDETSVTIAHHLLKVTDRLPPKGKSKEELDQFYTNRLFYYRSYQCRRFIGDALADALELPFHPSPWTRRSIALSSSFSWFLFRCYTLMAMKVPFLRKWMVRFHGRGMMKFHQLWNKTYESKMTKLMEVRQSMAGILGLSTTSTTTAAATTVPKEETPTKSDNNSNKSSMCPFAMIAPPTQ
ncbi:unnamed protein product [Cylindrotheca closterium]|uniref:ER-bound oxygenase mpaB/mpaB'/Rubber oxygenase catalytic domain-containing protein n=1 Tax=Cylindrotheca closterium TaxID=2856 RepID=A0AAD2JLT2_9STRA|nr:unnamed protein product [Cylindrotheca closterium]